MPIDEMLRLVRDGGSTALLVVMVLGGFKGWYVWRWQFDVREAQHAIEIAELRKDRDEWKAVALRGLDLAEQVTG